MASAREKSIFDFILVLGITTIALGLRVYGYDSESYWADEIFSLVESNYTVSELFDTKWLKAGQMPLYFILLKYWRLIAGDDRLLLLLPNIIISALCVPLVWSLSRRVGSIGRYGATLATVLVAFSPMQLHHAQELRMYPLLTFLALLSLFAFERAGRSWRAAPLLAGCSLALGLTHATGDLLIAAMFVAGVLTMRRTGRYGFGRLAALLAAGLPLLLMVIFAADFGSTKSMTVGARLSLGQGILMYLLFIGPTYAPGIGFDPRTFVFAQTLVGLATILPLAGWGLIAGIRGKMRQFGLVLIALMVIIVIASKSFPFLNQPKYLIYTYPLLYIVAGQGISFVKRKYVSVAVIILLAALSISVNQIRLSNTDINDNRAAAEKIRQMAKEGEMVVAYKISEFDPFNFYFGQENLLSINALALTENRAKIAAKRVPGIWLIENGGRSEPDDDNKTGIGAMPLAIELAFRINDKSGEVLEFLAENYQEQKRYEVGRVEMIHYHRLVTEPSEQLLLFPPFTKGG